MRRCLLLLPLILLVLWAGCGRVNAPNYSSDLQRWIDRQTYSVWEANWDKDLEEGVGRAIEIWVVVPIGGKLWLTRGAAFSQYEFRQPVSNRLTDEQWQDLLSAGKQAPLAAWTHSYIVGPTSKKPTSREEMTLSESGC